MKSLDLRIKFVEYKLSKKDANKDLDMRVEFYTCELGLKCPTNEFRKNETGTPEGLIIMNGKCQHEIKNKNEK